MSGAILAVDVGGTSVKAGVFAASGERLASYRVPTPRDPQGVAVAELVVSLSQRAAAFGELAAIGLVVPGIIDLERGVVELAVNLGWRRLPLARLVRERLRAAGVGAALVFEHDIRAGALAEARAGAASGEDGTAVFIPVGTGIGAALTARRRLVELDAAVAEIGQELIPAGPLAGLRFEDVASAGAVAVRAGAADAREVAQRARSGDERARRVWAECVQTLAQVVVEAVRATGGTTVIIGGGLALAGDFLMTPLRAAVGAALPQPPTLTTASFGDSAAEIGAALLAFGAAGLDATQLTAALEAASPSPEGNLQS